MKNNNFSLWSLMIAALFTLWGCGGSGAGSTSSTTGTASNPTISTASYKFEYIPVTPAQNGKSTFKIRLTNLSTGSAAAGKTISFLPMMHMTSMDHSAPFDAPIDNGDGTYTFIVYYLMSGDWELNLTVNGETATFTPTVLATSGSTVRASLKGIADLIPGMMGGTSKRTYYLFNDGLTGSGPYTFGIFIAALDNADMTSFPAVSSGSTLHDESSVAWTVTTITVAASSDGGTTWIAATPGSVAGHWSVTGLSGLASGGSIKVRVTINGEQKTTDGNALSVGTNDATTFTIVAGT